MCVCVSVYMGVHRPQVTTNRWTPSQRSLAPPSNHRTTNRTPENAAAPPSWRAMLERAFTADRLIRISVQLSLLALFWRTGPLITLPLPAPFSPRPVGVIRWASLCALSARALLRSRADASELD